MSWADPGLTVEHRWALATVASVAGLVAFIATAKAMM